MSIFKPSRYRDAYAVIRGYVFQVDRTIERWLALDGDDVLELECGEDIDLVSRAHGADETETKRLLEQVKHNESSVTLRSPGAISAIANAVEHFNTAPGMNLQFLYTTNAASGREQHSPLPKMNGIDAWEEVRLGLVTGDRLEATIKGVRSLLSSIANKPDNLNDDTWRGLQEFLSSTTDTAFAQFIARFSWSTGVTSAAQMADHIQEILGKKGYAQDLLEAKTKYERLFLSVFKLLCQPGRKQLNVSDRRHQLELPLLSDIDRVLLAEIASGLLELEGRVSEAEDAIVLIKQQLEQGIMSGGNGAPLVSNTSPPILDVPPFPEWLEPRRETVQEIIGEMQSHAWTAIVGGAGWGKSTLAAQVAQTPGNCKAWVRMRGVPSSDPAAALLDRVCTVLAGQPPTSDWVGWFSAMCHRIGSGAIIVLDDLPKLSSGDALAERLVKLTRVCFDNRVKLLTTSNHPLPPELIHSIYRRQVTSIQAPPLTVGEVRGILSSLGTPEDLIATEASTIRNMVAGHPQLLLAFARFLEEREWTFGDNEFESLIRYQYVNDLNAETIDKLLNTVADSDSRELLYRLNTVTGTFPKETAFLLASVPPQVLRPQERLGAITGLWIQRDTPDRFTVSPLIRALGDTELAPDTRRSCHLALADEILDRGSLDQFTLKEAIAHFIFAEEVDRAGGLFLYALAQANNMLQENAIKPTDAFDVLSMWWGAPLPVSMDITKQSLIRALQISVASKAGKDFSVLLPSVSDLVARAGEKDGFGVLGLAGYAAYQIADKDFLLANAIINRAIELTPFMGLSDENPLLQSPMAPIPAFIWFHISFMKSAEDVAAWITLVEGMTPELRQIAFSLDIADEGCAMVADRLCFIEADKPSSLQQWDRVLNDIRTLASRAYALNLEPLWAAAIRAEITILAEYNQDLPAAVQTAESALTMDVADPRANFFIRYGLGRQFGIAGDYSQAIHWLNEALQENTTGLNITRLHCLLETCQYAGNLNPLAAIQYAQRAVELAQVSQNLPETEIIKAFAELAIALSLAGNIHDAFLAWSEGAERLLLSREDTNAWKGLVVMFGYACGYYIRPPAAPIQDIQAYAEPTRGIFLQYTPAVAATRFQERNYLIIPEALALFAEAVGEDDIAANWALKGITLLREANASHFISTIARQALPALLQNNRLTDAVELALESSINMIAGEKEWKAGGDAWRPDFDPYKVLGPRTGSEWAFAERVALEQGIVPSFIYVATMALTDRDMARRLASELVAVCQGLASGAASPAAWTDMADIASETFHGSCSQSDLYEQAAVLPEGKTAERLVSLIASTLSQAPNLPSALSAHINAAMTLQKTASAFPAIYRKIIIPFFKQYWLNAVTNQRFRFAMPGIIEAQIVNIDKVLPEKRAQIILSSIALGLGIRVPPNIREWFDVS